MSTHTLFEILVAIHIVTGATGLISFWVPVAGRKGGRNHARFGKLFTMMMLVTGSVAIGIALTTLSNPIATHPQLIDHPQFGDPALIAGIFGWMMLYLATLTINLAWHGWLCIQNRRDHLANRVWHNLLLQLLLTIASANCAWQGWQLEQLLMVGISMVGFATVATNLWFLYKPNPRPLDRIKEHIKSLVGAGISVYTAFFAFGAVRMFPEIALTPALWSVPLITGLSLIIYHQRAVTLQFRARAERAS
ncbi:hypothetical protein R0135_08840 [Congregibacter variabilis]|uniref:DUF2306 domain-containing protein n=1 Tax=Congregibacter variabilis TaxID=3081200 RepID=A0ABZ0HYH6_9GAMM|nr:hypothetical protein R0135_08840 [Congregibacter sp. IMCC43200]